MIDDLRVDAGELRGIILSHGWYKVAPMAASCDPPWLCIPYDLPCGAGCVEVAASQEGSRVTVPHGPSDIGRAVAASCLSLDVEIDDLRARAGDPHHLMKLNLLLNLLLNREYIKYVQSIK